MPRISFLCVRVRKEIHTADDKIGHIHDCRKFFVISYCIATLAKKLSATICHEMTLIGKKFQLFYFLAKISRKKFNFRSMTH